MDYSQKLEQSNSFFFWKGRVALYAILKSLGVGRGDEVVIPGYTCVVVPNAVIYTGATPVYADIDSETYNVSAESIARVVTNKTKAIVVQSTYGLSPDLDPILDFARDYGVPVIDDCTHGIGGFYKGIPNGFTTDAAFFSTQWSKPVSTGLGGIAVVSDDLVDNLKVEIASYPRAGAGADLMLAAQRVVRPLADMPALHYPLTAAYRWLTQKAGLAVGSSSGEEISSTDMPPGFKKRAGKLQNRKMLKKYRRLHLVVKEREDSALFYDQYFENNKHVLTPERPDYAIHGMLRYSVQVANNQILLDMAKMKNIPIGDWFDTPIYPIYAEHERWGYVVGACPTAELVSKRVVNLPTEKRLTENQLDLLFKKA